VGIYNNGPRYERYRARIGEVSDRCLTTTDASFTTRGGHFFRPAKGVTFFWQRFSVTTIKSHDKLITLKQVPIRHLDHDSSKRRKERPGHGDAVGKKRNSSVGTTFQRVAYV
jgi:hypothetical protein